MANALWEILKAGFAAGDGLNRALQATGNTNNPAYALSNPFAGFSSLYGSDPSYHDNVQDTQSVMNEFLNNPELTNYLKNVLSGDLDFQRTLDLQQRQFDFNSAEAQKARDEYRDLSNTSYQRAVADLKAAGLNPALAATTGAGASAYAISGQGQGVGQYSLGSQGAVILSAIINGMINLSTTQIKALSSLLSSVIGAGSNVAKGMLTSGIVG